MSIPKKLAKVIQTIFRQALRISRAITNKLMNWLLRSFLVVGRRQARLSRAGFALPTVMMVILVVVLLTTAILVRSFDWSKNVGNYRVNQQVINAAMPALDRAKKKIEALLADQRTRGTPSEEALDEVLKSGDDASTPDKYTLGDENRLQLAYDFNGGGIANVTPSTTLLDREITTNAWRFPVDSDNNGKFDSITLYSILFRTPLQTNNGDQRERVPIEARALPMQEGGVGTRCNAGANTSASLVDTRGWYKIGSQLKRSFFVYVATVPITDPGQITDLPSGILATQLEPYKGDKKRFSGLEYQQDQGKTSVGNNAVFYTDDLTITAGSAFTINGRIVTNSNLFVDSQVAGNPITLRQVSSRYSCFYLEENGKIIVGGNVGYGTIVRPQGDDNQVNVDLFRGPIQGASAPMPATAETGASNQSAEAQLTKGNQSVDGEITDIAYNNAAYEARIESLVTKAFRRGSLSTDPEEVQDGVQKRLAAIPGADARDEREARQAELDVYFRKRTRKVPFQEVAFVGSTDLNANVAPTGSGEELRPPESVMLPFARNDGKTAAGYAGLELKAGGSNGLLLPKATDFERQEKEDKVQNFVGDRVVIGNNLPQNWFQDGEWMGSEEPQNIDGTQWDSPAGASPRQRKTRVELLTELGNTERDQFWEQKAAQTPTDPLDGFGGLRVVTGTGIYLPPRNFPNIPTDSGGSTVVWPDTMPVIPPGKVRSDIPFGFEDFPKDANGNYRPYLQMRATVVYHYRNGKEPIACVSSFYDPTSVETARNSRDLIPLALDVSGGSGGPATQQRGRQRPVAANSNNGITYPPPSITFSDPIARRLLNYQADLVYPNGRPVNPQLQKALRKARLSGVANLTLSQKAAIDSALCALQIAGVGTPPSPTTTLPGGYRIPHGTIKEVAFLDARQIKSIDNEYNPNPTTGTGWSTLTGKYDLPIELRQPLEVRATVLDLEKLRTPQPGLTDPFSNPEYLLPNSGIIYATRDDALPDASDATQADGLDSDSKQAAIDFKLDPTRRPDGIMLIKGSPLWRVQGFRQEEKGLILASNLPVYVKANEDGEFNPHKNSGGAVEEFTTPVTVGMSSDAFYNRQTLNDNFACRSGDTRLPDCTLGDDWRSATILTDALTLLSSSFREGYRIDGDYDLRNNQIDNTANPDPTNPNALKATSGTSDYTATAIKNTRLKQGFWENNFVTNREFTDSRYASNGSVNPPFDPEENSSYFNNFVTPIQRRGNFPVLLMEMCRNRVISECQPDDWFVDDGFSAKASTRINTLYRQTGNGTNHAGTTADPAIDRRSIDDKDIRWLPRRVAFLRDASNNLLLSDTSQPIILGVNSSNRIACYTYSGNAPAPYTCEPYTTGSHRLSPNALWFRTTTATGNPRDGVDYGNTNPPTYVNRIQNQTQLPRRSGLGPQKTQQPLLVPVLQIQYPTAAPSSGSTITDGGRVNDTRWLQQASCSSTNNCIYNLTMATGDNPEHPAATIGNLDHEGDFNGALANLPHFLENWSGVNNAISGSFIQIKRSSYATAPFTQLPKGLANVGAYPGTLPRTGPFNFPLGTGYPQGYKTGNNETKMPSYLQPTRNWGFDVGLLSQSPDLFSQQFVLPPTEAPNEFFREVNRNDEWLQTLLCAKIPDPANRNALATTPAINSSERPDSYCQNKTGG